MDIEKDSFTIFDIGNLTGPQHLSDSPHAPTEILRSLFYRVEALIRSYMNHFYLKRLYQLPQDCITQGEQGYLS